MKNSPVFGLAALLACGSAASAQVRPIAAVDSGVAATPAGAAPTAAPALSWLSLPTPSLPTPGPQALAAPVAEIPGAQAPVSAPAAGPALAAASAAGDAEAAPADGPARAEWPASRPAPEKTNGERAAALMETVTRMKWRLIRLQIALANASADDERAAEIAREFDGVARPISQMDQRLLGILGPDLPATEEDQSRYEHLSNALSAATTPAEIQAAHDELARMQKELAGRVGTLRPQAAKDLAQSEWVVPDFTTAVDRLYARAAASGLVPNDEDAAPQTREPAAVPLDERHRELLGSAVEDAEEGLGAVVDLMPRAMGLLREAAQEEFAARRAQGAGVTGALSGAILAASRGGEDSPEAAFLRSYAEAGRRFEGLVERLSEAVLAAVPAGQRVETATGIANAMSSVLLGNLFSTDLQRTARDVGRKTLECLWAVARDARSMPQDQADSLPSLARDAARLKADLARLAGPQG